MKLGIFSTLATPIATPDLIVAVAEGADERGIDTLWVAEHVVLFDEYESRYPYSDDGKIPAPPGFGFLEPFDLLAFAAARTERIRLGTGITILPQRSPLYVAKHVASVDWMSGGRVDLGIGVGWLEEEFDACNVPFDRRGERTDEYITLMRTLWREETPHFDGEFWTVPTCRFDPKPVQSPPPIHVGGITTPALRRAARSGDGWYAFNLSPDELAPKLDELARLLDAEGRTLDDLEISVCPYFAGVDPGKVEAYAALGVDQVIALHMAMTLDDVGSSLDALAPVLDTAHSA